MADKTENTKPDSSTATEAVATPEAPRTSIEVPLQFPVEEAVGEGGTRRHTSLTLRRMKARDAMVAENETNQTRAGYRLFAALAGVSLAVIEDLDIDDLAAVGEAAAEMMGKQAKLLVDQMTDQGGFGATS